MSKKNETAKPKSQIAPKDLKPKKDAKGGLLLPAVQKVREAAARGG
ncbi:MAG: hypothetical protein R3F18_08650 [Lysobacterales bacterium]|nr:hypothetical protein [Xanthomonadales bacterium]MCB1612210.1 hypothetical protein [Xanthomonadales bacterium]MCP5477048.1 hypothetical protein [Rhodanobacteraceae bacterium]